MAESQGKILNSNIKQYPFTKLGNVDTKELIESVQNAEIERLKDYQGIIISAFKDMAKDWDEDGSFVDYKFNKIKDFIKTYEDNKE